MKRFLGPLLLALAATSGLDSNATSFTKNVSAKEGNSNSIARSLPESLPNLEGGQGLSTLRAPDAASVLSPQSVLSLDGPVAQVAGFFGIDFPVFQTDKAGASRSGASALPGFSGRPERKMSAIAQREQSGSASARALAASGFVAPVAQALEGVAAARQGALEDSAQAAEKLQGSMSGARASAQAVSYEGGGNQLHSTLALLHRFVGEFSLGNQWKTPGKPDAGPKAELSGSLLERLAGNLNVRHNEIREGQALKYEHGFGQAVRELRGGVYRIMIYSRRLSDSYSQGRGDESLGVIERMLTKVRDLSARIDRILTQVKTEKAPVGSLRQGSEVREEASRQAVSKIALGVSLDPALALIHRFVGSFSLGHELEPVAHAGQGHEVRLGDELLVSLGNKLNAEHGRAMEDQDRRYKEGWAQAVHELRNPASSMVSALDFLRAVTSEGKKLEPADDRRKMVDIIGRNARRLGELVNEIVILTQLRTGKYRPNFGRVDVGAMIRQSVGEQRALFDRKGQKVILDVPDSPVGVRADQRMLGVVVSNLLSNAIKYTPQDGEITIRVAPQGDAYQISIKDNGIGMTQAEIQELRKGEGFYRTEAGKKMASGSGVGMTTILDAVEKIHGVPLEIRSSVEPGASGTKFSFSLPAWRAEP